MLRTYLGLIAAGIGICTCVSAFNADATIVLAIISALTLYVLVTGWVDLRLLRGDDIKSDLAEAEKDVDLLLKQSAEHARDAAFYCSALIAARNAIDNNDSQAQVRDLISKSLAEQEDTETAIRLCVNWLTAILHDANKHWWRDPVTGEKLTGDKLIVPTKLMLIVSEISEAMEAHRKSLPDDKLPEFDGLTVELGDALIRILDLAGALRLQIGDATAKKVAFNAKREDHTDAGRSSAHGKAY